MGKAFGVRAHANMGLLMYKELGDMEEAIKHYAMALRVFLFHDNILEKLRQAFREMCVPE